MFPGRGVTLTWRWDGPRGGTLKANAVPSRFHEVEVGDALHCTEDLLSLKI